MHREIPCDYLYNAENHWGIPYNYQKNSGIKGSDILWSVLECKKLLEKVVKVTIKKTNKKLKVTIKFTQNVDCKYLDAKIYIAENVKEKT